MTTNIARVAGIIALTSPCDSNSSEDIALALHDAGLLMPDLPEPDNGYPEWLVDDLSISPGLNAGEVDIEWEGPMLRLTPDQVLAFLAAYAHTERNQA